MNQFIGPFNFDHISLKDARNSFSKDWTKFFKSQEISLQPVYCIAHDGTHVAYSYEFGTAGAGTSKNDCLIKLMLSINGLYGHHLLKIDLPLLISPKINGLKSLQTHLESIGWIFTPDGSFLMTTLNERINRVPAFKENVLDKVNYEILKMDFDLPVFS